MLLGEVEWGSRQEARESKIGVALFTPTQLFLLHCTPPSADCKQQTVLPRGKLLIHADSLLLLLALSTFLEHLWCHPSVWEPSCSPAVFYSGDSKDLRSWMKWIASQWRWRWHLGRQVWWCPAKKVGLFGISSSKPRRDTESSWSRWALLSCIFLHSCHEWSTTSVF